MTKAAFNKEKAHQQNGLEFEAEYYAIFGKLLLYGAETWTLRKLDQKYLGKSEIWCWRRLKKISWTDRVGNEDVSHRIKEERNILHKIRHGKVKWIGHILGRNCLLKHVIEGRIEVMRRRRIRRKLLLKESRGYWKLKREKPVLTL